MLTNNLDIEKVVDKASETAVSKFTKRISFERITDRNQEDFVLGRLSAQDLHIDFGQGRKIWQ